MKVKAVLQVVIEIEVGDVDEEWDIADSDIDWEIEDAVSNAIAAGVAQGLFPDSVAVSPDVESQVTEWK